MSISMWMMMMTYVSMWMMMKTCVSMGVMMRTCVSMWVWIVMRVDFRDHFGEMWWTWSFVSVLGCLKAHLMRTAVPDGAVEHKGSLVVSAGYIGPALLRLCVSHDARSASDMLWFSATLNAGFALPYNNINIIALSATSDAFPEPCIYIQLDVDSPSGDAEGADADADADSEMADIGELRLIPTDAAQRALGRLHALHVHSPALARSVGSLCGHCGVPLSSEWSGRRHERRRRRRRRRCRRRRGYW
jgi:hypothetical protein